jgi:hypothetical protein
MRPAVKTNGAFHLRLLHTDVTIESHDARWMRLVRRMWAPFARSRARSPLRVSIEPIKDGWLVAVQDREPVFLEDPWSLLAYVAYEMEERALNDASDVQDFHAAAVALDERGLLIAGPSRACKTSIALELLGLEWTYLTDDRALIHRGSGKIIPFPEPAGIKDARKWPRYRVVCDGEGWPPPPTGTFFVPAPALGAVREKHATPRFVVFLRFEPGASLEFEEVSAGRAVALASQYVRVLSPDAVRVLARLCRETRAVSLVHGDSGAAARLIDGWVREAT